METTKQRTAALGDATNRTVQDASSVDLRNPWIAGLLAWLLPGCGHWYQRRRVKAAIFGLSIWSILLAGLAMGSYWDATPNADSPRRLLIARNVYLSWRPGDKRLYFLPQAAIGAIAIPAWIQARTPKDGTDVLATAFAPPRLPSEASTRPNQPSADEIVANLHSWFDVGVIFTVVAGLLNLLAIFDAIGGPVPPPVENDDDSTKKNDENDD